MPTRVIATPQFEHDVKRLLRKYRHLRSELETLAQTLQADERPGEKIPHTGYDVYKVRMANPSAGRGKRGGFRVIYYVRLVDQVFLITIYSKTEQTDIPTATLQALIADVLKAADDGESPPEGGG